jgi:hypothetical protein
MKTQSLFLAGFLTAVILATRALAEAPATPPAAPDQPAVMMSNQPSGPTALGVPQDVLLKMTPEQIAELGEQQAQIERMRRQDPNVIVPILGVIFVFGMPIVIVALVVVARHRRQRMLHETVRAMVDKGVPIPAELLQPDDGDRRTPRNDFRSGLVWSAIGLGLLLFLGVARNNAWPVGFIPLLIGVALLVTWKIESAKPQINRD